MKTVQFAQAALVHMDNLENPLSSPQFIVILGPRDPPVGSTGNLLRREEGTQVSYLQKWNALRAFLAADCETPHPVAPPQNRLSLNALQCPFGTRTVLALFNEEITDTANVMGKWLIWPILWQMKNALG